LKRRGFSEPARALANLHAMTPEPRDAELLAPFLPRLLHEMAEAPDPDMALNNLERLAAQGERPALFRLLAGHPGALHLVARLGGAAGASSSRIGWGGARPCSRGSWSRAPCGSGWGTSSPPISSRARRPSIAPRAAGTRSDASSTASFSASGAATSWGTPISP